MPNDTTTMRTAPLGETGLKGIASGMLFEEFLPALRGAPGARKYKEMADNDPVIGGFLYATSMLLRAVEWRITPADESPAAQEAAEFVEGVLFDDMATSFPDVIEEALSMLVYGFAPLEIVYKLRRGPLVNEAPTRLWNGMPAPAPSSRFADGKLGIHKLSLRAPETILRWYFDEHGELVGLEQQREAKTPVSIPRWKFLLFRTVAFKNNPEGRSILRSAYVSVERKKVLEIAEGRLALRSAGIVVMRVPEELLDPSADDETKAVGASYKAMADSLARDRQGAVVLPSKHGEDGKPLYDVQYLTADGRRPSDVGGMIDRLDKRIAASVLADFLMLGASGGGSLALSKDKTEMFTLALYGYLSSIAAEFNRHLLPQLWALNGFDEAVMPALTYGEVERENLDEMGRYLTSLASAGLVLFPNKPLADALMAKAGLPELPEDLDAGLDAAEDEDDLDAGLLQDDDEAEGDDDEATPPADDEDEAEDA